MFGLGDIRVDVMKQVQGSEYVSGSLQRWAAQKNEVNLFWEGGGVTKVALQDLKPRVCRTLTVTWSLLINWREYLIAVSETGPWWP